MREPRIAPLVGLALLLLATACERPRRAVAPDQEAPPLAPGAIRIDPHAIAPPRPAPAGAAARRSLFTGTATAWTSTRKRELQPLDLAAARASGQLVLSADDADFEHRSGAVTDGNPASLARGEGANPLTVTLTFAAPIRLRGAGVVLAGSSYDWSLEARPGDDPRVARDVPQLVWSLIALPEAVETAEVRLRMHRLERDDIVHVNEIVLYVE